MAFAHVFILPPGRICFLFPSLPGGFFFFVLVLVGLVCRLSNLYVRFAHNGQGMGFPSGAFCPVMK